MHAFNEVELRKALQQQEDWLGTQSAVVGHGVGLDKGGGVAIKVFVDGMPKAAQEAVRSRFAGLPVVIEDHGEIRPQVE